MHVLRSFGWALALVLFGGCYSYAPLPSAAPNPGVRVSAELTDLGTARLAVLLGQGVRDVDGPVVASGADTLALSVLQVRLRTGEETYWKGETVALPRGLIGELREKRFSRTRSALPGGVLAGGALLVAAQFDVFGSGGIGNQGERSGPR